MANEEEQRNPDEEPGGPEEELSQDPFVEKVRPDPSEPPTPIRVFEGFLGKSDRGGYWRLYFSRDLDNYAEFRQDDVVFSEPIPPDQPPYLGLDTTRAGIRRDATIEYTRTRTPRAVDEFDLDIRLGPRSSASSRNFIETDPPCTPWPTEVSCPQGPCPGREVRAWARASTESCRSCAPECVITDPPGFGCTPQI